MIDPAEHIRLDAAEDRPWFLLRLDSKRSHSPVEPFARNKDLLLPLHSLPIADRDIGSA